MMTVAFIETLVGAADGTRVGEAAGRADGVVDGARVGNVVVGFADGAFVVGFRDGAFVVGIWDGARDGRRDGVREGERDGFWDGVRDGERDGRRDGRRDGERDGERDGFRDGFWDGARVGDRDGDAVMGFEVGESVGGVGDRVTQSGKSNEQLALRHCGLHTPSPIAYGEHPGAQSRRLRNSWFRSRSAEHGQRRTGEPGTKVPVAGRIVSSYCSQYRLPLPATRRIHVMTVAHFRVCGWYKRPRWSKVSRNALLFHSRRGLLSSHSLASIAKSENRRF
jgi:hypothetical protein